MESRLNLRADHGESPEEARRRLGNRLQISDIVRAVPVLVYRDQLFQDLRYPARRFSKSPRFTAAAVLTFALDLGASTAVFSVVDRILFRPLAYAQPDRLVWLGITMRHEYVVLNVREMDGEALFASDDWADNEWALLTKTDPERVIRVVLEKLNRLHGEEKKDAAATFLILGGILGMEEDLRKRIDDPMIDIMQNRVFGPMIREQLATAHQEGHQEGHQEALRSLSRRLIEKRFGPLPVWAQARLADASAETLTDWTLTLDEADSLEAAFRS